MSSIQPGKAMPVVAEPVDLMRQSQNQFRFSMRDPHPVDHLQSTAPAAEWSQKLARTELIYGPAAAMRMRMDAASLRRIHRAPGLPSSFVALDTMMGRDTKLEFEDVLGDPMLVPEAPKLELQERAEALQRAAESAAAADAVEAATAAGTR